MKLVSLKMKLSKTPDAIPAVTSDSNAVDVANAFLSAQGYDTEVGMCLRWHRSQWLRYTGKIFVPMPMDDLRSEIMRFIQGTAARAKAKRGFAGDVILNLEGRCGQLFDAVRWAPLGQFIREVFGVVGCDHFPSKDTLFSVRKHADLGGNGFGQEPAIPIACV